VKAMRQEPQPDQYRVPVEAGTRSRPARVTLPKWQPARTLNAHGAENLYHAECVVLRITPIALWQLTPGLLRAYRNKGCKSMKFYGVHPDDTMRLTGSSQNITLCEHEILTD